MLKPESGFIGIGNAKLYYELSGEGQPLVLIHAGVADNRQWNNEFAHFAQDYRVLRYDLRGYGKSLPVDGEFSHLGDLTALLDLLRINQPLILVGCSMGGGLALDFALAHPPRVRALVMVGSGPSGLDLDVPSTSQRGRMPRGPTRLAIWISSLSLRHRSGLMAWAEQRNR